MSSSSSTCRQRFIISPLAATAMLWSTHGIIGSRTCRALSLAPRLIHVRGGRLTKSVQDAHGTRGIVNARFMSNADVHNEEPFDLPQHTVTFRSAAGKPDGDISFFATDGEILRTSCLRRGLVSPHNGNARLINCRGLGTCGTCAVEIESACSTADESPSIEPPQRNNLENIRLEFPPHGSSDQSPKLRLACQVQVRGDIVVTKRAGFWGQASASTTDGEGGASEEETTMVDPSDAKTYFGELEYLLDRRSPQKSPEDRDNR